MKYTKFDLASNLLNFIDREFSPEIIAEWAHNTYLDTENITPEAEEILSDLMGMCTGKEFEYSESEIRFWMNSILAEL